MRRRESGKQKGGEAGEGETAAKGGKGRGRGRVQWNEAQQSVGRKPGVQWSGATDAKKSLNLRAVWTKAVRKSAV